MKKFAFRAKPEATAEAALAAAHVQLNGAIAFLQKEEEEKSPRWEISALLCDRLLNRDVLIIQLAAPICYHIVSRHDGMSLDWSGCNGSGQVDWTVYLVPDHVLSRTLPRDVFAL